MLYIEVTTYYTTNTQGLDPHTQQFFNIYDLVCTTYLIVITRSPCLLGCLSSSTLAVETSRMVLMLLPPRPITLGTALAGTITFLDFLATSFQPASSFLLPIPLTPPFLGLGECSALLLPGWRRLSTRFGVVRVLGASASLLGVLGAECDLDVMTNSSSWLISEIPQYVT